MDKVICLNLSGRYEALVWASRNFLHKNTELKERCFFVPVNGDDLINVENPQGKLYIKSESFCTCF